MKIRQANSNDLDAIMDIYEQARRFMRQQGNLNQWANGYPQKELMEKDIRNSNCYVCIIEEQIVGVFCYFQTPDPTYTNIYEGSWLNDEPYGVIHRIATVCHRRGIANACYEYALSKCPNLRIDTHHDNHPMQRSLEKYGFHRCGIIYLSDGNPRIAYQIMRSQ